MRFKVLLVAVFIFVTVLCPLSASAENDPRDSISSPAMDGLSLFLFYYRDMNGYQNYQNGKKTNNDLDFKFNLGIFRYAHFKALGDWTWSYDVLQPVGNLDVGGSNASGLGDINAATHINSPYLVNTDDMKYMMSAGFYMTAPTGDYSASKGDTNIGANRWSFKFEYTPVILQFKDIVFELTGDVTMYTENDDYTASAQKLEKDPLFGVCTHLSYNVTKDFWVGASYYLYSGGETAIDGADQDNEEDTQALRFSFAFNLSPKVTMLMQYQKETHRDNGIKQDYVGTRVAYAW